MTVTISKGDVCFCASSYNRFSVVAATSGVPRKTTRFFSPMDDAAEKSLVSKFAKGIGVTLDKIKDACLPTLPSRNERTHCTIIIVRMAATNDAFIARKQAGRHAITTPPLKWTSTARNNRCVSPGSLRLTDKLDLSIHSSIPTNKFGLFLQRPRYLYSADDRELKCNYGRSTYKCF